MKRMICAVGLAFLLSAPAWSQGNNDNVVRGSLAKSGSVQLQATILPDYIDLRWSKGPDEYIGYFELYRSADGVAYNFVKQFVPQTFDARQNVYTFRDEAPLRGKNYYRLVGYDKFTQERRVVDLEANFNSLSRKVTPTLVPRGNQLNISNYNGEELYLRLFTSSGTPVLGRNVASGVISIASDKLASGFYVYQLVNRNRNLVSSGKILLQ